MSKKTTQPSQNTPGLSLKPRLQLGQEDEHGVKGGMNTQTALFGRRVKLRSCSPELVEQEGQQGRVVCEEGQGTHAALGGSMVAPGAVAQHTRTQ